MSIRKNLESRIYAMFDSLDTTGKNTQRIKKFYDQMSDAEWKKYMIDFFTDVEGKNFSISYIPFENDTTMELLHKAAKANNVDIYEYIYRPDLNDDPDNPAGSVEKIMVIDIPMKRLQQMLFKKNNTSTTITKRNPETGQVTGEDKVARVTDVEAYSLIVQNQYDAAREFYTFRSDDMEMKSEALLQIAETGEVSLDSLTSDIMNKTALNNMMYYMLASGLKTNIIEESGMVLPNTIKGKEEKLGTVTRSK